MNDDDDAWHKLQLHRCCRWGADVVPSMHLVFSWRQLGGFRTRPLQSWLDQSEQIVIIMSPTSSRRELLRMQSPADFTRSSSSLALWILPEVVGGSAVLGQRFSCRAHLGHLFITYVVFFKADEKSVRIHTVLCSSWGVVFIASICLWRLDLSHTCRTSKCALNRLLLFSWHAAFCFRSCILHTGPAAVVPTATKLLINVVFAESVICPHNGTRVSFGGSFLLRQ